MKELFELVKERPDPSIPPENICPFCESTNVQEKGHSTTLLGSPPGEDWNHHWRMCRCQDCEREFCHEHKNGNHWYVEGREGKANKILKGIPSCFEGYAYTCTHCEGDVIRHYTALDGESKVTGLCTSSENGKWVKKYRIFYECQECKTKVETPEDYCRD